MEDMHCLYPKKLDSNRLNQYYGDIRDHISKGNISILDQYKNVPYVLIDKNGEYVQTKASVYDAARLYVALEYIISKNKNEKFERLTAYQTFFDSNQSSELSSFLNRYLKGEKPDDFWDIEIDLVKGSIYKIKKYFLENDKIKDIRGGSVIIDYLNIHVTNEIVQDYLIDECKIYSGGGNVFLIAPKGIGEEICRILEQRYSDIALTVQNAFETYSTNINDFLIHFNQVSQKLTIKLEERKKAKIYPINPDSSVTEIKIDDEIIRFPKHISSQSGGVCELCQVRDSKYILQGVDHQILACPSCMRKHQTGRDKSRFYTEYQKVTGKRILKDIKSIEDLGDDNKSVAVIYGDGNNMGNVVKNIKTPFEMSYFSRRTDEITKSRVYHAIEKNMGNDARFEIIALGGDDIFIIVPANYCLDIAKDIVKSFDAAFKHEITMSVGICIAKFSTPIKNMFAVAQKRLKTAKQYVKERNLNQGSIDLEVLQGVGLIDWNKKRKGFFPSTSEKLSKFIEVLNEMKRNKDINSAQIYKFRYAAEKMEPEEFKLFYLYQQSRIGRKYSTYIEKMYNIEHFMGLIQEDRTEYSPWDDIAVLWDYTREDAH
ncbi:Cas10/Cmr2 second palm domain-containing protein [Defluviitalea raffinosedens]|jgi:hypothetical protein|uniref:Cas10/Cmr2 second palm domain-containing protein n=1 Tax=Defluviitalea raffinosedens TaxID=1450156 RepID=UPI001752BCF0|nr:hypothetical protein [Defluviitalea raffinosedens]MBM7685900.1 hypothetical protein [Defluviitalea raffinosedens]MBZ4668689.1 hypothetical protein [Defluviitaleaceae bacterium]HHW68118.1 hypothetical protein [Candidatus Epulonipiscium sp.]